MSMSIFRELGRFTPLTNSTHRRRFLHLSSSLKSTLQESREANGNCVRLHVAPTGGIELQSCIKRFCSLDPFFVLADVLLTCIHSHTQCWIFHQFHM